MALVAWPSALTQIQSSWRFARTQRYGPETLGGVRSIVAIPGGRWYCTLQLALNNSDRVLAYRGWLAAMLGMENASAVPVCDPYGARSYTTPGTMAGSYSANATAVVVSGLNSAGLVVGMYIGIGSGTAMNLHMITAAAGSSLTIEPGLRAAVTAATPCSLAPTSRMRLLSPGEGAPDLQYLKFGTASINMIEAYEET